MYYIGTQAECIAYNEQVKAGERYDGVYTTTWAKIIEHPNGADYAILKHPKYDAELTIEESLSEDWFPPIEEQP